MFVLGTIVFCFAVSGAFAADVFSGNWKLNLEKSKYDPGPPPKGPNFSKIDAHQFISCCPDARIHVYQMIPENWYTVGVEIPKRYLA